MNLYPAMIPLTCSSHMNPKLHMDLYTAKSSFRSGYVRPFPAIYLDKIAILNNLKLRKSTLPRKQGTNSGQTRFILTFTDENLRLPVLLFVGKCHL